MWTLSLLFFLIVAVFFWIIKDYNELVQLKIRSENAWSDIDVQLKRRYDLVPNLEEVVRGYAEHEKKVFEDVTRLRSQAMQATETVERGGSENMFSSAIKSLFAVAESYPQLKADQNFRDLQKQL
ncbi:MAG: LemA family protein, partial [Candidatus Omnitrophica bacterium]|nr:LemA family protein [Candidatus Omnitrophota bacterium]